MGCGEKKEEESPRKELSVLVHGVIVSLAADDYQQFLEFTCLGMGKAEFKEFMAQSRDSKVVRVWNSVADDFFAEFKNLMRNSFQEAVRTGKQIPGWNWKQATIVDVMFVGGDVIAVISSGNLKIRMILDDCFQTPSGILTFDAMFVQSGGREVNETQAGRGGDFEKLSPFTKVSCVGDKALVTYSGKQYELVAIDGLTTRQIFEFCKRTYEGQWEKRFAEDLVEVMSGMGKAPGRTVNLDLRDIAAGKVVTVDKAPMTGENRRSVWGARQEIEQGSINENSSQFTKVDALQLVNAFEKALAERWAYYKANNANFESPIITLKKSAQKLNPNQLGIELQKIIALGIDGHAGIKGYHLPGRYLPFLIAPSGNKYVAFKPDRSGFLLEDFPIITGIDGQRLSVWIKLAKTLVSKGSPQYTQNHCLRLLRSIEYFRGQLGVDRSNMLEVELASRDNSKKKIIKLPLSSRSPVYGVFPEKPSSLIPGNIGYLRLRSMDRNAVDEILGWMPKFRDTNGLIVDVRNNGGGTRDALRILYSFLAPLDSEPRVTNCAKYRLHPNLGLDHLAARFMYRETATQWTEPEQATIAIFKEKFKPRWNPPEKEFSQWHYLVLNRMNVLGVYYYDKPVVVLMNSKCFSATDIFLAGLKDTPNVILMGTPSGGGSARAVTARLGNFSARFASMASFQPDGRLFDGNGVQPDVHIDPIPEYYIGVRDNLFEAAVERIDL